MATILNFPKHLTISIVIIILATLPTSNGSDNTYKSCTSLISCGRLQNVGYPFWGLGRPRHCGHPELHLHCPLNNSNVYPFLKFQKHGVHYYVRSIRNNSTSLKMTIQLQEHSDTNNSCPFHPSNRVFEEIFQSSENVDHMNLFYNCSNNDLLDVYHGWITCSQEQTNIRAYYLPNATTDSNQFKFCKFFKNVPVFKKELDHFKQGSGNLSDLLMKGYEVDYLYASACFTCQDFGGICGSSSDKEFACFRMYHKSGQWKLIVGLAIPGAVLLIALIGLCYCKKPKLNSPILLPKKLYSVPMNSDVEIGSSFHGIPVFSYNEIREATNNFDVTQELGHGGYGIVYHGRLRDGTEVAVKRFHEKNYKQIGSLINEIEIFTRLHHTNLVKLYGCTTDHSQELLLVYGLIPNGTVADHLYGDRKGFGTLSWDKRMKIAIETASVLSYLHASDIIHHDVKTNNILLDNDLSVKVADLGLSRLFSSDTTHIVSTDPQGTPGYIDPDYNKSCQVTNKSDVYSFGVVLVELISSLPALDINRQKDEINLSDYAMRRIQHGTLNELVDQKLEFKTNSKVKMMITLVAELAFRCLQQDKELRPSMDEVLDVLKQIESMDYESLKGEDMTKSRETSKPTFMPRKKKFNPPKVSQFPPSPNSVIENWTSRSCESNVSA